MRFRPWLAGFTLIEVVVALGVVGLLVVTILTLYTSALNVTAENRARVGAVAVAEQRLELIRNLPYPSVGTAGGIPAGVIQPNEAITLNHVSYTISTSIVFVDDPFDGTQGGSPNDPLANDYKKVRLNVSWVGRFGQKNFTAVTTVAPKGIETILGGGTLAITVFNANGNPVPQAQLTVENPSVTPPVNLTALTDDNGKYLLPGAPASINSYRLTATKSGFSTDRTCAIDLAGNACTPSVGNPQPTKPHASVLEGQVSAISFAIDQLSTLVVRTIRQATPGEWVVNTAGGSFDQDNPAMTICPNGHTLFVWRDFQQNNNPRIFAQQYDVNRNPVWSPDLAVTTSNNQNLPDVAVDGNCNIYYAWQDDRNGNQDIYFDKYSSAGVDAWLGEKKVDVAAQSADQTWPQVIVNASSTFLYLVWQDNRSDAGDIYSQRFNPDGVAQWASEVKVNRDSGTATQSLPEVIVTPYDETLYLTWYDNRSGHNDIYANRYDSTGVMLWADDRRMNGDTGTSEQLNPSLARAPDGSLYLAWEDQRNGNSDIYAQRYSADGSPQWAADLRVNSDLGTATQVEPVIAVAATGEIYVAWEDNRNGTSDIYLQKLDSSGNKLISFDVLIHAGTAGEQRNPDLTFTASGKPVVVWQDNASGNFDIRAAVYGDDPQTVTPVGNVTFTLRSGKRIGENPVIPKYQQNHATDSTGTTTVTGMEWDNGYTLTPVGYTLLRTEPAQPVPISPNTTQTVILNLQ